MKLRPQAKIIHPGASVSDADVAHILGGIRARTLPKPEWTHGAHLCAGTALLKARGLAGAEAEMPDTIRAYNEATGVPNTDDEGYHHTITLFYLRTLDKFLDRRWHERIGQLATDVLAADLADRTYPLQFYSKELLFSVTARRSWIEGDL